VPSRLTRRLFIAITGLGAGLNLARQLGCIKTRNTEPRPAWKAGVARVRITPEKSVWMTGYASRKKPSEGTLQDLYARVLALEAASGGRAVLVTTDILGFPAPVAAEVADRCRKRYGLERDRLMLTSSHTHGGPAVRGLVRAISSLYMTAEQERDVEDYTRRFAAEVTAAVGQALADLRPARLSFGLGAAPFAVNRRKKTDKGYVIDANPDGPVDHDVPVLRVDGEDGRLRAVVFLYACHNTTLGGDIYQFHGDYAGFAEAALEERHSGATAMFIMGCGGDCNPHPRGTVELARQYGQSLADAVDKVLAGSLRPAQGRLRAAWGAAALPFGPPPTREDLKTEAEDPKNPFKQLHARRLLEALDRDGRLPESYPCPVQAWRLGDELTIVALSGEVVVDYSLRLKKELGPEGLWVAAYCNDVFAYVPSRRVLEEGGYEGGGAMVYYGHPGPFAPEVEETLIRKVRELAARVQEERHFGFRRLRAAGALRRRKACAACGSPIT